MTLIPPAGQLGPGGSATTVIPELGLHFIGVSPEGSQPGGPLSLPGGRLPATAGAAPIRNVATTASATFNIESLLGI